MGRVPPIRSLGARGELSLSDCSRGWFSGRIYISLLERCSPEVCFGGDGGTSGLVILLGGCVVDGLPERAGKRIRWRGTSLVFLLCQSSRRVYPNVVGRVPGCGRIVGRVDPEKNSPTIGGEISHQRIVFEVLTRFHNEDYCCCCCCCVDIVNCVGCYC